MKKILLFSLLLLALTLGLDSQENSGSDVLSMGQQELKNFEVTVGPQEATVYSGPFQLSPGPDLKPYAIREYRFEKPVEMKGYLKNISLKGTGPYPPAPADLRKRPEAEVMKYLREVENRPDLQVDIAPLVEFPDGRRFRLGFYPYSTGIIWDIPLLSMFEWVKNQKPILLIGYQILDRRLENQKPYPLENSIQKVEFLTDLNETRNVDADMILPDVWKGLPIKMASHEPAFPAIKLPDFPAKKPGDYAGLLKFFGTSLRYPDFPGFYLLRDDLVKSLWACDPQRTLQLFQAQGDLLWQWITPSRLFDLIGWEWAVAFDNLDFVLNEFSQSSLELANSLLLANVVRGKDLRGQTFGLHDPEKDFQVWNFLKSRKVPLGAFETHLRFAAGVLPFQTPVNREFTREELLYQGLLIRLGLEVEFPASRLDSSRSSGALDLFPSLSLNRAIAGFYSGKPRSEDLKVLKNLSLVPKPYQDDYQRILLASPSSVLREEALQLLGLSPPPPEPQYPLSTSVLLEKTKAVFPFKEKISTLARGYTVIPLTNQVDLPKNKLLTAFALDYRVYNFPWLATLVLKDEQNRSREYNLGRGNFYGQKKLTFRFPLEVLATFKSTSVVEVRLYWPVPNQLLVGPETLIPFTQGKLDCWEKKF